MSKTLLIDGNSIGYAAHHATKLSSGGLQTQAVFGFIKTMRELRATYRDYTPVVLWDGKAQWRFDLNPDYKSNRTDDPKKVVVKEAYAEQKPYIIRALKALGIRQITASTHEADDLAGLMVSRLATSPENEIVLISGDMDWVQLVRPNVTWRDMRDDAKVITMKNLMDKTGYATPYGFLEGKCLTGDSSDCISGVGGIGEKGAPEFIAEFGSVRKFWQRCDSGDYKPTKKALIKLCSAEGRAIFGRNLRMMQLLKVAPPAQSATNVESGAFNRDDFEELCAELAFTSILKQMDAFCSFFNKETK
jgi:5'-3' exonuclease